MFVRMSLGTHQEELVEMEPYLSQFNISVVSLQDLVRNWLEYPENNSPQNICYGGYHTSM